MKKLIFLTMLSVLIFIGCENTCTVTEPGIDGIELDWIYETGGDIEDHKIFYTDDNQVTLIDTSNSGELLYGIKEIYEELGYVNFTCTENHLTKCVKIELFLNGSQDSYFSYSLEILPDVIYNWDISYLRRCVWREK